MLTGILSMALTLSSAGFPQLEEERPLTRLEVVGVIPPYLEGTLVRNGPALFEKGEEAVGHPFDGLAMLHAFSFRDGRVDYRNRFLRTTPYEAFLKEGSLSFHGFATDPCGKIFAQAHTRLIPNANVSIAQIANETVAMTEIPLPVRFDLQTLETLGLLQYADHLPKEDCFESAHPQRDPDTGDLYNYQILFTPSPVYQIYRIPKGAKERVLLATLPVDKPSYMHSFALTEHALILAQFPLVVDPQTAASGAPFITAFRWEPERGTRYLIIDRQTGELKGEIQGEPYFAFHHINAHEAKGAYHLDLVSFPDATVLFGGPPSREKRGVRRVTLHEGKATSTMILERPCEMPRIAKRVNGKPYQFAYLADYRMVPSPDASPPLIKLNVETGEVVTWSEKGCQPGEPVFVAKPGATREDEGVVLAVILDSHRGSSFLLVLDGETFQEIGRAYAPHPIPIGLHGDYI
ncbi:MAG: carotenoid oxygenase family protein [Parachlamydiales bacterium]